MTSDHRYEYFLQPPREAIQMVTPEMARFWLDAFNYVHQRRFRQWHTDALTRVMLKGAFRKKTQINFCRLGDAYHLTNGQHTLAAIIAAGIPQLLSVIVLDVSSQSEIADDFSRHDSHMTRQLSDSLAAHETHLALGVTQTQLRWIVSAASYFSYLIGEISTHAASRMVHDEKLWLVEKYGVLGRQALENIAGYESQYFLTRRSTLAAIMACTKGDSDLARQFWSLLASDDGLKLGDPRKTLRTWLADRTTSGGSWGGPKIKKIAADHEFIKAIAMCWNAWIEGKEYKLIRVDQDVQHVTLLRVGTLRVRGGVAPSNS